jgi:tRNA pseudouridine38-40 synthase
MVRRLVIYLVEVGQGKRNPEEINGLLRGDHKNLVQGLAPAQGLTLEEVIYLPEKDDYNSKK